MLPLYYIASPRLAGFLIYRVLLAVASFCLFPILLVISTADRSVATVRRSLNCNSNTRQESVNLNSQKTITFEFSPSAPPSEGFMLESVQVDSVHVSRAEEGSSAGRLSTDRFDKKSDQGLAALALLFIHYWKYRDTSRRVALSEFPGRQFFKVWTLNGTEKDHAWFKLQNMIKNRAKSNFYLYHLFYHDTLLRNGVSIPDFNGKNNGTISEVLREIETQEADRVSPKLWREYSSLVYLGCVLQAKAGRTGSSSIYMCQKQAAGWNCQFQISEKNDKARPATDIELASLEAHLASLFPDTPTQPCLRLH